MLSITNLTLLFYRNIDVNFYNDNQCICVCKQLKQENFVLAHFFFLEEHFQQMLSAGHLHKFYASVILVAHLYCRQCACFPFHICVSICPNAKLMCKCEKITKTLKVVDLAHKSVTAKPVELPDSSSIQSTNYVKVTLISLAHFVN